MVKLSHFYQIALISYEQNRYTWYVLQKFEEIGFSAAYSTVIVFISNLSNIISISHRP